MIDFSVTNLDRFASAWVGCKSRYEGTNVPNKTLTTLNSVTEEHLTASFLKPFEKTQEFFYFTGEDSVEDNAVYNSLRKIFADPETLASEASVLTQLLYEHTENPKIHGGDFFMAHFTDVTLLGEPCNVIGLWKVEDKDPFFRTERTGDSVLVSTMEGIQTTKPKVAALIFNLDESEGYRVCAIDTVSKKTERSFWKDGFLKVHPLEDDYFQTVHTVNLTAEFLNQKAPFKFSLNRLEVMTLTDRALNYFKDNDEYERDNFAETVFSGAPEGMSEAYIQFHDEYQAAYGLSLEIYFNLNPVAVKKYAKALTNRIKMDSNFILQVKGRPDLIESGYDEEKGKKFYKVFFEEQA